MRTLRRLFGTGAGWKTFAFEVAIVVVGVAIALSANHFATVASRKADTRQAMRAIETDLVSILILTSERMAVEPCRMEQERALIAQLSGDEPEWVPDIPENLNEPDNALISLPILLRTPHRLMPEESWKAFMASPAALYVDRDAYSLLNYVFSATARQNEAIIELWKLRGRLSHLAFAGPISAAERRQALALVGEISAIAGMHFLESSQLNQSILTLYVFQENPFEGADGDAGPAALPDLDALIEAGRSVYGPCYDTSQFQPTLDLISTLSAAR